MAIFTRNSTAFTSHGGLVNTNIPRYAFIPFPWHRWQDFFTVDQRVTQYTSGGDVPAVWVVEDNLLRVGGVQLTSAGEVGSAEALFCTGGAHATLLKNALTLADCELTINSNHVHAGGLIARHVDNNNYYLLALSDDSGGAATENLRILRRVAGVFTQIASVNVVWARGAARSIRFLLHGARLEVWFDGVRVLAVTDTTFSSGAVGLYNHGTFTFQVLDFTVHQAHQAIMGEEGTTNLLTANQSSVETDLVGFATSAAGTTLTRDTAQFWHGTASLRVACNGAGASQGFFTTNTSVAASQFYSASVWLRGSGNVHLILRELDSGGAHIGQTVLNFNVQPEWARYSISRLFGVTGVNTSLQVTTNGTQIATFWADGLKIEQKPYATAWHLSGTTRVAESLTVPTAGVFNRGNWAVEGVCVPQTLMNVGNVTKTLHDLTIDANNFYRLQVGVNGEWRGTIRSGGVDRLITSANNAVVFNLPYHWQISGDGAIMRLCVNGAQIGELTYTEPVGTLPANMSINTISNGLLSNLRFSNRARTLAEHQAVFNTGQPFVVDANTTAIWYFNSNLNTILHHVGNTPVLVVPAGVFSAGVSYVGSTPILVLPVGAWSRTITQPQFLVYELADNFIVKDDCPMGKMFTVGSHRPVGVTVIPAIAGLTFSVENATFTYISGGQVQSSGAALTGLNNVFSYILFNQPTLMGIVRFTFNVVVRTALGAVDPNYQTETFVTDVEVQVV